MAAGDETALARQLGVPVSALVDWLLGHSPVPADIFLRAVDVVLISNRQQVEDNRAFLEQVRRRYLR